MANAAPKKTVVGIDLGTTFSCIAVEKNNQIEVVANDDGDRPTASAVFFDSARTVGKLALEQSQEYPGRTVHSVKRLIGRQFNDPEVQKLANLVKYTTVNVGGEPSIRVDVNGSLETYRPEQVSAMILGQLKQDAEKLLGYTITGAVITVPAAFNETQRLATKHAGMIAGLDVLAVINEPTAAALAWAYSNPDKVFDGKTRLVLVFDMGGGTTDVSIVSISSKEIRVTSTIGDPALGGNDVDDALVRHFVEEIKDKHERDISQDSKAMIRLRQYCNAMKHQLSKMKEVKMVMENVVPDVPFKISISRAKFENIIDDIIEKATELVQKALEMHASASGNSTGLDIDTFVLVGGSSKMPWVERIFKDTLADGKPVEKTVSPDEAIAKGAGVYAAKLAGSQGILPDIRVLDVAPLSYGIEVKGGEMSLIIQRNTPVPASHTRTYTTDVDMQKRVRIQVYQGDAKMCSDNKKLREFDIPVEPAPKGVPDIHVTFSLSKDFMLTVTAKDLASKGEAKSIRVDALHVQTQEAIEDMRKKEEMWREAENRA